MKAIKFAFLIFLLLCEIKNSKAQPGIRDTSFGINGIGLFNSTYGNTVRYIGVQSDGKILAGGGDVNGYFFLIRYKSNGFLDSSFGINGYKKYLIGGGATSAGSIVIQPDGRILFSGHGWGASTLQNFIVRVNPDGALDNTFNGTGYIIYSIGTASDHGGPIILQPDGKIVQVGTAASITTSFFSAARFNSDGSIDNTFGTGGKVTYPIGNNQPNGRAVALQADGKILIAGESGVAGMAPVSFALMRLNTNGSLDNSFGNGGKDTLYFAGAGGGSSSDHEESMVISVLVQQSGKIILFGDSWLGYPVRHFISLCRYNTNGTLDLSFGNGGRDTIAFRVPGYNMLNPYGNTAILQPDGKIIIGGSCGINTANFLLYRLDLNGGLDSTFSDNGYVIDTLDNHVDAIYALAMQQDGKILSGGYDSSQAVVVRYLSGLSLGILDLTEQNNSLIIYPNPVLSQAIIEYELVKEENINIELYDITGRFVQHFIINENQSAGVHKTTLHVEESLPPGNYILRVGNGKIWQSVKLMKD